MELSNNNEGLFWFGAFALTVSLGLFFIVACKLIERSTLTDNSKAAFSFLAVLAISFPAGAMLSFILLRALRIH